MNAGNAFLSPDEAPLVAAGDVESAPAPLTICWRCGKQVSASEARCPYCEARLLMSGASTAPSVVERSGESPIVPVCVAFAVMLLVSIVQAVAMLVLGDDGLPSSQQRLWIMLGAEAIDTVIVVCALVALAGRLHGAPVAERRPLTAWCLAPVILLVMLTLNAGYHGLIRAFLGWPVNIDVTGFHSGAPLVLLAVCVQPAVVEELFFRYLAIGALRASMGVTAAVVVSSVMFGMAHVGSFLSIPVLIVLGLTLGWLRVKSGGLALPMLTHFAHNAAISFVEQYLP